MRGRLALADIDLSAPLPLWLDAVYTVWAEAPIETLTKMNKQLVQKSAMLRPDEARETWGMLPEHQAMSGGLGRGPGLEAGRAAGKAPQAQRPHPRRTPMPRRPA